MENFRSRNICTKFFAEITEFFGDYDPNYEKRHEVTNHQLRKYVKPNEIPTEMAHCEVCMYHGVAKMAQTGCERDWSKFIPPGTTPPTLCDIFRMIYWEFLPATKMTIITEDIVEGQFDDIEGWLLPWFIFMDFIGAAH